MSLFQSILLGIIQGITEFLPISSSGHLVLVPHLLGWNLPEEEAFIFNVLVQVATLAGVIAYFWKDLWAIVVAFIRGIFEKKPFGTLEARLGWLIILATIPAGLFGLLVKPWVEKAFSSPYVVGGFLIVTALLLVAAERVGQRSRGLDQMTWLDVLVMGFFQALAIFPGISRSGATIVGGMLRDLDRPAAARFSFIMSIPIMLAAGLLESLDLLEMPNLGGLMPVFLPGFITAAVVGYLSIRWLLGYLTGHRLYGFAIYCVIVGALILGLGFFA